MFLLSYSSPVNFTEAHSLGYTFYDIFFKLRYCSKQEENKIINAISKMQEVGWFVSSRGEWHLVVCIMSKSPEDFKKSLDKVLEILGEKVIDYDFFIVIEASQLQYKEVLEDTGSKKPKNTYLGKQAEIKLKKADATILEKLATNCRCSLVDLAEQTNLTIERVRYAIKKLENLGIIQAYKPLINTNKLGYIWNIMLIQFHNCPEKKKQEFMDFLKNLKQVFYIVKGVGNWSLMTEFHTKNIQELDNIRSIISSKFENIIRDERLVQVINEHKCVFLPKLNV